MAVNVHVDYPIHQNATVTASGNSSTFSRPVDPDASDHRGSALISVGSVSGTSPSAIFKLQASLDGVNWFDVAGAITFSAVGTGRIEFSSIEPFHQLVWIVSGTTPSFGSVNSHLVFLK